MTKNELRLCVHIRLETPEQTWCAVLTSPELDERIECESARELVKQLDRLSQKYRKFPKGLR